MQLQDASSVFCWRWLVFIQITALYLHPLSLFAHAAGQKLPGMASHSCVVLVQNGCTGAAQAWLLLVAITLIGSALHVASNLLSAMGLDPRQQLPPVGAVDHELVTPVRVVESIRHLLRFLSLPFPTWGLRRSLSFNLTVMAFRTAAQSCLPSPVTTRFLSPVCKKPSLDPSLRKSDFLDIPSSSVTSRVEALGF